MSNFLRKPEVVEAYQWFKNGDHPEDQGSETEGSVVRYYRHPSIAGAALCPKCHIIMHEHGWIDQSSNGQNVCPGDWVIKDQHNRFYTCAPDLFEKVYQPFLDGFNNDKPERTSMRIRKL